MKIFKSLKDKSLERRVKAFDEFLTLYRERDSSGINLPTDIIEQLAHSKHTRQVEKLNRQIREMNGL